MRVSRQDIADFHRMLDVHGNGYVTIEELCAFLEMGGDYHPGEANRMKISSEHGENDAVAVTSMGEQIRRDIATKSVTTVEEASKVFRARVESSFAGPGGSKDIVSIFKYLKCKKGQGLTFSEFWKQWKLRFPIFRGLQGNL